MTSQTVYLVRLPALMSSLPTDWYHQRTSPYQTQTGGMTADTGNSGQPGGSATAGRGGHSSSHISSAIPTAVDILVLAGLVSWYLVRRIRLRGRSLMSILTRTLPRPELYEMEPVAPTLPHTTWNAILVRR